MSQDLKKQMITAAKWSTIAEIVSKLVVPISTVILARLLTPDAFGILVTATMIISFAEIFSDAGFHKYLIQHEFTSDDEKYKAVSVAFICNFLLSLVIWGVICLFSRKISLLVGCPGKEMVVIVSCVCIPISSFFSIQSAIFKRHFDFKTLFVVRFVGTLIPLVITIPLAFFTRSYWALIIGMIAQSFSNALILTVKSPWKPKLYFNRTCLKDMFSFSMWSMFESVSIWLTGYIDIFIVGSVLNQHFLGIYTTSMTTVGQIMGLITSATTPILYSSLSRLQNDDDEFKKVFFSFQKIVGLLVVPLGFGIFLFKDLCVKILLGNQWLEAIHFVGLWGLTSSITIILSHYSSEVYRAKGKPKLSVLAQCLHIAVLLPVVLAFVRQDFDVLCTARSVVRFELILVNMLLMHFFIKISPRKMVFNVFPAFLASVVMSLVVYFLPKSEGYFLSFVYIIVAVLIYMGVVCLFKDERNLVKTGFSLISSRIFLFRRAG
jgi:PST family polysaccharide transporter